VPAHLSGRIFEAAATVRPTRLQQATLAKIAEITPRGALDQIDGEFQQAHFPGVIDALDNGAESFIFALDEATVEVEPGSGELQLRVKAALLGEETYIHRFGYQVVAHVHRVRARISGTILVPREILDIEGWPPADTAALFEITANTVEMLDEVCRDIRLEWPGSRRTRSRIDDESYERTRY